MDIDAIGKYYERDFGHAKSLELQSNNLTFKEYSYLLKKSRCLIQLDVGANSTLQQNLDTSN